MSLTPMEELRRVWLNHQYVEVHGMILDATTANAMLCIYDALSNKNQAKFETMVNAGPNTLMRLVDFCWDHVELGRSTG